LIQINQIIELKNKISVEKVFSLKVLRSLNYVSQRIRMQDQIPVDLVKMLTLLNNFSYHLTLETGFQQVFPSFPIIEEELRPTIHFLTS